MGRPSRVAATAWGLLAACMAPTAMAQESDPMVLFSGDGLTVRSHFQAGVNLVTEQNLFWDLAATFAPTTGFSPDTNWLETYVKPGISFDWAPSDRSAVYGKLSSVWSYTLGTDAYDTGDTGRLTLEEGYLGVRFETPDGVLLDFSGGARELKLGTGMLIANGGSSGFERGALKLGPRKAWEGAGIAKMKYAGLTKTAFYLDPNETETNDSKTALAGADIRYDSDGPGYIGLSFLDVFKSNAAYAKAALGGFGPPDILPGAREGLKAINLYARTDTFPGALSGLFLTGDFAYEWHDDIDMRAWAGRAQAGYRFAGHRWTPTITYAFQTFSGDDPDTDTLERFDPLFYEGTPASWATGSKSSMTFINSNVHAHQVTLSVSPTPRDTITFRFAHIRANELRSPIQFGQATRFDLIDADNVIAGVTDPHLADDFFVEYFRVINQNTFLTAGISASVPGEGLELVVKDDMPVWLGGFVNVVVNF